MDEVKPILEAAKSTTENLDNIINVKNKLILIWEIIVTCIVGIFSYGVWLLLVLLAMTGLGLLFKLMYKVFLFGWNFI